MACVTSQDIRLTGGCSNDWTMWDPAAGSGRLYECFTSSDRYASDLRNGTSGDKKDKRFFQGIDFLEDILRPLTHSKQIYVIANPPYGDMTYRFINRAFDGTYPIKRALFLVSGGDKLLHYLWMIDYTKCVLLRKSLTFAVDFEIMLEPRGRGKPLYRPIAQKVQLLLFYSTDEFRNMRNRTSLSTPIIPKDTSRYKIRLSKHGLGQKAKPGKR
jgi:hypothetical protein